MGQQKAQIVHVDGEGVSGFAPGVAGLSHATVKHTNFYLSASGTFMPIWSINAS
ncbi:MAG: hypothetical protein KAV99_03455 [Candidatus Latescibacteria bacterium]|nr:hypothetical protein [Candidatus Latescibacterota bacterium]